MSLIGDIRDAAIAKLATLLGPGERLRPEWVPTVERKNLTHREIFVSVERRETKLLAKQCKQDVVTLLVGIVGPLYNETNTADDDKIESGSIVVDKIIDGMLDGVRCGTAMCTAAEQVMPLSPEHYRDFAQFTTFVRLTMVV